MQEIVHLVLYKFVLILFIILYCVDYPAQTYPDSHIDSILKTGIRHIVNQEYDDAKEVFNSLDKDYPHLPLGKIYLAANMIAEAFDYSKDFDEKNILKNLEAAKEQSSELIRNNKENIWYRYFYALAEGYISYFEAMNGNWFSALSTGVNSISAFEKILIIDNNFFESFIAIGTFEYWKSRKMEFMNWLPFTNDTKETGINLLKVAVDSSSYNSHLAVNSLIWIYIDQKRYDDAIKIAEKALSEFPESRTFKWGLARAYEEKNSLKAIELYLEILNSYPTSFQENYKNEITLKHLIAQQYAKLGENQKAIQYCDEILAMKNIPQKTLDELSGRLERVKSLKKELSKKG